MTILFAILLFSILIFVHELGHFVAAKLSGVQVNEFAIFMGPAIFKKQKGETLYSLRCIPVGGYCAMEGEDQDTDNPRSFQKAAWWKRLIILVAGSAMNLITGFLLAVIVYAFSTTAIPQIDALHPDSTMAQAGGLQPGDVILAMDDRQIDSAADISVFLDEHTEQTEFDVRVERNGQELLLENVVIAPKEFSATDEWEAGTYYGFQWATRNLSIPEVFRYSWDSCVYFGKVVWLSVKMLVSGEVGLSDMSGPVGIVSMMNTAVQGTESVWTAVLDLLYFGSFIAVNLGIMNLLPIPALDGGRVVALLLTTAIEKITRKKIDPKYEGYIHAAGMVLLLGLMAVIMFKDIFMIFKG